MSEMKPTRDGFGTALAELGAENENIVVFSGDLEDATRAEYFKFKYPERFFNLGITEQDIIGSAAGISADGFVAFACSFAVFLTNRGYDMIRLDVCYNKRNVKLVGSHTGVTVGEDGATAQCLEDFAIMRVLPNMTVVCPMDFVEAQKATRVITDYNGPVYMRLGRAPFPIITKDDDPFVLGKANVLREGKDVTLIGCGLMVHESLQAAEILSKEGIEATVINMHTIKPLDEEVVIKYAKETGAVVTAEEHQLIGGLGGAIAEVLSQHYPCPQEMVAVRDSFGQSGKPAELLEKYELKDVNIALAAKKAIKRK